MKVLLFLISILPTILLGFYIYNKDTEKEPKSLLLFLFFTGLISAFLVVFINLLALTIIPNLYLSDNYTSFDFIQLFILSFFEIALVEEFCKWIMVKLFGYSNKAFDQLYDIIVYSVFVSLGFATIENIFYVMQGGLATGIYRALFSVPGHVAFGIFMGHYLGLAKIYQKKDKNKYKLYLMLSLLIPTLLHTIYNFFLMLESICYLIIFLGFIIILYVKATKEIEEVSKNNEILK